MGKVKKIFAADYHVLLYKYQSPMGKVKWKTIAHLFNQKEYQSPMGKVKKALVELSEEMNKGYQSPMGKVKNIDDKSL